VLVTGAAGFLGFHVAKELASAGASVRALVRKSTNVALLSASGIRCVEGDLENKSTLAAACAGCEYVFHVAGVVDFGNDWQICRRVNIEGTRSLVDVARQAGVRRLVHTSSIVTVGAATSPNVFLDEDVVWNLERLQIPYVTVKTGVSLTGGFLPFVAQRQEE
jgi:dihydroflavonol-4-reductase